MPWVRWVVGGVLVLFAAGCGDDDSGSTKPEEPLVLPCGVASCDSDAESQDAGSPDADQPDAEEPQCEGVRWEPGTPAFREATADWGLDNPKYNGLRISAADFDGDGLVDLSVRQVGVRSDDFAEEGVRRNWLFRNTGTRFEDVTEASGIRARRTPSDPPLGRPGEVVVFGDVDNDGDLDAYVGLNTSVDEAGDETSELMLNDGDGTFSFGPEDSELRRVGAADVPASGSFVDFDRDGNLDIWVVQNYTDASGPMQDRLFKGDGSGRFTDVTADAGLTTSAWTLSALNASRAHTNGWSGAACDLNNDGLPELLSASYGRAPNHLWRGAAAGDTVTFTNYSAESGYAYDQRRDWTDNDSAQCFCKSNRDAPDCADVPEPEGYFCSTFRWSHDTDREVYRLGGVSGTTVCADIDNDGWIDLLTNEIVHYDVGSSADPSEILFNTKDPLVRFERPGNEVTGLVREHEVLGWNDGDMTSAVFDFDNDGWQDIYIGSSDYAGTRGYLYHQDSPGHFRPVPLADGIDHRRSHGIAVADFDNDGDLDVVVGHSKNRCEPEDLCYDNANLRFFENVIGDQGRRIELKLEGTSGSNRAAIGARVEVAAGGVTQVREVGGGHGHFGIQQGLWLTFGLGTACSARVTVRWPDAQLTTQSFTLEEGSYTLIQGGEPQLNR